MPEQKEVIIFFGKEHNLKLLTENPEELLDLIISEVDGWFRYKDKIIKRDVIKYVVICPNKAPLKSRSVKTSNSS